MSKYLGSRIGVAVTAIESSGGIFSKVENYYFRLTSTINASGGNQSPTFGLIGNNGFKYWTFTGGGTFTVSAGQGLIDVLVLAGGGGGGAYYGGGGGAGGAAYLSSYVINPGSYAVTVGGGGAGSPTSGAGTTGTDSTFSYPGGTITAKGGGAGSFYPNPGRPGGCGGGSGGYFSGGPATQPTQNPGQTFVTNYGYAGGAQPDGGGYGGGGGGGTSQVGFNGQAGPGGGNGGAGVAFTNFDYPYVGLSPLVPQANSPTNNQYGGGGGGGIYGGTPGPPNISGLGGAGGGGSAPDSPRGSVAGVANLGGGGQGRHPGTGISNTGGSGVVIIRTRV